jgi:hypothetical protein
MPSAIMVTLEQQVIWIFGFPLVIKMQGINKRASGRPKDLADCSKLQGK